jgi:hypothetical protein
MKVGKKSLKLSSGKIVHFKSEKKREDYEKVAKAIKHGWKPSKSK